MFYSNFTGRSKNMPGKPILVIYGLNYLKHKDWLRKKADITGQYSYYAKEIYVSNMGESASKSHAGSRKHQSRSPTEPNNSLSFFDIGKNEENKERSTNSEKDKRQNKPTSSGQKTIDDTFTRVMFYLLKSDLV